MNRILQHFACLVLIIAFAVAAPAIAAGLGLSAASLLLIAAAISTLPQFHPAVFERWKQVKLASVTAQKRPGLPFAVGLCALLFAAAFGSALQVAHLLAALTFITTSSVILNALLPLPRDFPNTPPEQAG